MARLSQITAQLTQLQQERLGKHALTVDLATLKSQIEDFLAIEDGNREGFQDINRQRDLSVRYHWGHDHDFGDFALRGVMRDRHIRLLAHFIHHFGLPLDLTGKRVLDVGVWTGGTSLLMAAMGAEVVAMEEVVMYAETVNLLATAFGLEEQLQCRQMSLYSLDDSDSYDYIHYAGVIYHVTDPVLSLRLLFNALKDGGKLFVETFGMQTAEKSPMARIESTPMWQEGMDGARSRGGWNHFVPNPQGLTSWMETAGFTGVHCSNLTKDSRILASGVREQHLDMLRAGLSRPNVR
uniref:Uncharacterized protein n=1 Tax=Magnetococcus massalia (strain MO-1) TaxID=451514 RepID=A0A1S7LG47_MAGMO|nr:protein of unknown function [Candidatus Magnetococcus massalia]